MNMPSIQNVTIDFNGSNFTAGQAQGNGWFIAMNETVNNITIANFSVSGFGANLVSNGNNVTFENINSTGGLVGAHFCYPKISFNTIARNIKIFGNSGGGVAIWYCKNLLIQNINSTGNSVAQLKTLNSCYGNITIRDSFFYDGSAGTDCVQIADSNVSFINNTVKYCSTDNKVGVKLITNVSNLIFENNTIGNNSLNLYITNTNNSLFRGNKFGSTSDNDFSGAGFGGSVGFITDYNNNLVINNTFTDSIDTGITLTIGAANQLGTNTSITGNRFYNTFNGNHLKDIYVLDLSQGYPNNVTVWLNHFYGPNGTYFNGALNTDFCVGGKGNFYNGSLSRYTDVINETDCGLMNITQPDGFETIINSSYNIQWTNQSAMTDKIINYSIYYRNVNVSTWTYLASTIKSNYSLNTGNMNDSSDYIIKIIPFDGEYNGTNDNSTHTFIIDNHDPDVSLTPSSSMSMDLGGSQAISCSTSDSTGIASMSLTKDGQNFGTCLGTTCSDTYTMGDTSSKIFACSATDSGGRTNSKSITISLFGGSGGGGAGGGGGGGEISETIPITENEPAVTEQAAGQTFNIAVDGINYEAEITQIYLASITANIAGQNIDLVIGESKELDINNDKINDVVITLNGIKNGNAELTIKLKEKISEEKPAELTEAKISVFYETVNKLYSNISNFFNEIFNYIINLFKDVTI